MLCTKKKFFKPIFIVETFNLASKEQKKNTVWNKEPKTPPGQPKKTRHLILGFIIVSNRWVYDEELWNKDKPLTGVWSHIDDPVLNARYNDRIHNIYKQYKGSFIIYDEPDDMRK